MERRRVAVIAAAGTLLAGIAGVAVWRVAGGGGAAEARAGASMGVAIGGGGEALAAGVAGWRRPSRCMGDDGAEPALSVGARSYARAGGVLRGGNDDRRVVIGVVADARGSDEATLANARWAAGEFARGGVDVVVALGGMGGGAAELEAVLAALAPPAGARPWLLVAVPGDREPVDDARAAVAALRARGVAVADGSLVSMVVVDGVAIGLVPGLGLAADGSAPMLIAGADGCGHDQADLDALAGVLAAEKGPRLIASYAPPRQPGDGATDLALGGVHVGEPALAALSEQTGALALVHGWVDENAGRIVRAGARVYAAAGALSPTPVPLTDGGLAAGTALIVEVDGNKVRVRAVRAPRPESE